MWNYLLYIILVFENQTVLWLKPPPAPPNFVIDAPTRRSGASWMHSSCNIHSELKIVNHDRRSGLTTMIACTESLAVMTAFLFWHTWKLSDYRKFDLHFVSAIHVLKVERIILQYYVKLFIIHYFIIWKSNCPLIGFESYFCRHSVCCL